MKRLLVFKIFWISQLQIEDCRPILFHNFIYIKGEEKQQANNEGNFSYKALKNANFSKKKKRKKKKKRYLLTLDFFSSLNLSIQKEKR